MSIFNNKARGSAQSLKSASDEAKLEGRINQEKSEINEAIMEIGKIYYESYRNNSHEKLVPICNMIDESYRIIGVCEKQMLLLKGIQICPNCKATLDLESLFCNKCGTKLDAVEEINFEENEPSKNASAGDGIELVKCHECGSVMPSDLAFCTNCGVKMKSV